MIGQIFLKYSKLRATLTFFILLHVTYLSIFSIFFSARKIKLTQRSPISLDKNSWLVIVPGIDNISNLSVIYDNVQHIRLAAAMEEVLFSCIAYTSQRHLIKSVEEKVFCRSYYYEEKWWNQILLGLKDGHQNIATSHVMVIMDIIDITQTNFSDFVSTMKMASLDALSFSIHNVSDVFNPRTYCELHRTKAIHFLATFFRYSKFQSIINQVRNEHEISSSERFCDFKFGVSDRHTINLENFSFFSTYTLSSLRFCDLEFPLCHNLSLRLASDTYYKGVTHRGGWFSIINRSIEKRYISDITNYPEKKEVLFIDCIEDYFQWHAHRPIREPWIGVAHLLMLPEIPNHLKTNVIFSLDHYIEQSAFLLSAPFCLGLVIFTFRSAHLLREKLDEVGLPNIPLCVVRHPILEPYVKFNLTRDLEIIRANASFILLGQQYRRLSTIHMIQSKRRKIWMPSRIDEPFISEYLKRELIAENVSFDPSVEILRLENHTEYDNMLNHNIIIMDLWAAGANNAILEAITMATPFLVRKIGGVVEYLGNDYPLYFTSFHSLESILLDELVLFERMRDAHLYLQNIPTDSLSLLAFNDGLKQCALTGFSTRMLNK